MNTASGLLTIDMAALRANYGILQKQAGPSCRVGAVVKANAYGLGLVPVGRELALAGCRDFFVATPQEGAVLRTALPDAQIVVLNGYYASHERAYAEQGLRPAIGSYLEIREFAELGRRYGRVLPAWLSFNLRMNRLGLGAIETEEILAQPARLDGIEITGIMSHFACADEPDHPMTQEQYEAFDAIAGHFPNAMKSLANSSGIFRSASYCYDLVRPGMALYGLNPVPERPNPMHPVIALKAPIMRTRIVYAGASVGYGATWKSPKDTPLAVVSAGYADGIFRSLSNRGVFWWRGYPCPIRGRVSMDMTTVDLSAIPEAERPRPGDFLDLIGPDQDADTLATAAGTIGYEILTSLGGRYRRAYINSLQNSEDLNRGQAA